MNEINKKFRRILKHERIILKNKLKETYENFENNKKIKMAPPFYKKLKKPKKIISAYNRMIESRKEVWHKEFYEKHIDEFEELKTLDRIISFYKLKKVQRFHDFNVIQRYMDKHNLDTIEQGTVLAYFMNFNILYFKNYRLTGNEEEVEAEMTQIIAQKYGHKKNKKQKRLEVEREVNNFDYNQEVYYQRYKKLRIIINEDGELIPILEAVEFFETEQILKQDLTDEQAKNILSASRSLSQKIKKEEAEKNLQNEAKLSKNITAKAQSNNEIKKNKEAINKERRAKVELRKYLKDKTPIIYIMDEQLNHVISLLKAAGYSKGEIITIKRAILEFNKNHLELRKKHLFENAKHRYLIVEEISLLSIVETIITNSNAVKNPFYFEIESLFNEIKERLIILAEVKDEEELSLNYELEYMTICLEELNKLLVLYRQSNYKLVLEKNSN